jgi:hypothetical protein
MGAPLTSGNCCGGARKPHGELRSAPISVGILEIAPGSARGRKEMARRSHVAPSTTPGIGAALPGAYRVDLLVGRKPAGLLLRKGEPAIDGNLKHPTDPGHQLDIGAVFLFQPIPRTEGTRFIVSGFAPLNSDFHRSSLSRPQRWCSSTTRLPQLPGAPPERATASLSCREPFRAQSSACTRRTSANFRCSNSGSLGALLLGFGASPDRAGLRSVACAASFCRRSRAEV